MTHLLCRNKVKNFDAWKKVFDSHHRAQIEAGLVLTRLWRSSDDPDNVFFLFEVRSVEEAERFMRAPEAVEAGWLSGVIDGEYHFLDGEETA